MNNKAIPPGGGLFGQIAGAIVLFLLVSAIAFWLDVPRIVAFILVMVSGGIAIGVIVKISDRGTRLRVADAIKRLDPGVLGRYYMEPEMRAVNGDIKHLESEPGSSYHILMRCGLTVDEYDRGVMAYRFDVGGPPWKQAGPMIEAAIAAHRPDLAPLFAELQDSRRAAYTSLADLGRIFPRVFAARPKTPPGKRVDIYGKFVWGKPTPEASAELKAAWQGIAPDVLKRLRRYKQAWERFSTAISATSEATTTHKSD